MNSKIVCLLLSALVSFSITLSAQQPEIKKTEDLTTFKLGAAFMPQTTFIKNESEKNDSYASPEWKKGYMTGLTAGIVFSEKVSFDFGVLYSIQGINYTFKNAFYSPISLSYAKIPFTLNYRPFIKYKIPLEFTGGFQYSGLLKAVIDMPQGYYLPGADKQWFNTGLFDVVAGLGFNTRVVSNLFLNTKFRVDYSLSDPINKDYVYNKGGSHGSHWKSDRTTSHNITLGFLIGLEYHFGKL